MSDILLACSYKAGRPAILDWLHFSDNRRMKENIEACWKLCDDIVAERKAHPKPEVNDLLNIMLTVEDPETKRKLSDENIRYQMATFLVSMSDDPQASCVMLRLFRSPAMKRRVVQWRSCCTIS